MALPPRVNKALDLVHKVTVGVLAVSAAYFSVEIFRASWAIQEAKFGARQQAKAGDGAAAGSSGGGGGGTAAS
jgi:TRAP-type C4-dicarboxylate transport system permease small subunit